MERIHYKAPIPTSVLWNTNQFFYIDDIRKTCVSLHLPVKGNKVELLNKIRQYLEKKEDNPFLKEIVLIQRKWREYRENRKWRGPGFMNKSLCTNREDFYTLDTIEDTGDNFFFSYKDSRNIIFFFDIRSFEKLVEEQDKLNPYTRQPIPKYAIEEYKKRKLYLVNKNIWKDIDCVDLDQLTEKQILNLRIVDIVTQLNQLDIIAGGIDVTWFSNLSVKQLKQYYACIEDVWNYRASLNKKQKLEIIPSIQKLNSLFPYNVKQVMKSTTHFLGYKKMINLLMNIIETMISSSEHQHHRVTAANYVMIALTEVSPQVANAVPWLAQNNY